MAGQARVQEVYNQLKLTESYEVRRSSSQAVQLVTLVAAVVLTVITQGATAELIASAVAESAAAGAAAVGAVGAEVTAAAAAAYSSAIASTSTLAASAAAGAMAGNATAQLLTTGKLDAGQVLKSGLSGAVSGGIDGYYGSSWSFDRVLANSVAGGISAQLQGGQFKDGFKSALVASSARYGWDYTRQATDNLKVLASSSGGDELVYDERGQVRTDGARDTDWSLNLNQEGNWLTRSGMEREGSGQHWYDPGGPLDNKYLRYFVTDVSKMHDWFNSWNYNPANGFYMSRGEAFDSVFQLYSFAGMPVAGALTALGYLSQAPFNQFLMLKSRKDSQ